MLAASLLARSRVSHPRAMRVQNQLEGISESLRIPGSKSLGPIQSVRHVFEPSDSRRTCLNSNTSACP